MGSIKKIKDEYVIEFYARGLKYQQKAGSDRALAEKTLKEIEEKIARGEAALIVRDIDVDIFLHDFLDFAAKNYPSKTVIRFSSTAEHFGNFLKHDKAHIVKLSEVTPGVIEDYRASFFKNRGKKAVKPSIVNLTLLLLRDIFEYAIKLGYINDNPTLHAVLTKTAEKDFPCVLSENEIYKLIFTAPENLKQIMEIMYLTGLSVREVLYLKYEDLDRVKNLLKVRGQKAREIPLHPKIQGIFGDGNAGFVFRGTGEKLKEKDLNSQFAVLIDNLHLNKAITLNTLRHSFAKRLTEKGVLLGPLHKILGHSDIAKSLIYARFFQQNIKEQAYQL